MKRVSYAKPLGYIEYVGKCTIQKVDAIGKKYKVFAGTCFWRFATIQQARSFAMNYHG